MSTSSSLVTTTASKAIVTKKTVVATTATKSVIPYYLGFTTSYLATFLNFNNNHNTNSKEEKTSTSSSSSSSSSLYIPSKEDNNNNNNKMKLEQLQQQQQKLQQLQQLQETTETTTTTTAATAAAIINNNDNTTVVTATKIPVAFKLMVAAAAGLIGTTLVYPIDMIKTRLMSSTVSGISPFHLAIDMYSKEGINCFYRGLNANLMGCIPEKAIKLVANDILRDLFTDEHTGQLSIEKEILSGAGAGFMQVIATNPMEIVKIRLQMQTLLPIQERQSLSQVMKSFNIPKLYTGTTATLLRDVPFSMVFFPLYSNLKMITQSPITGQNSNLSSLLSGVIAGGLGAALVTPMDRCKTLLQVEGGIAKYGTLRNCFQTVVREEGMRSLFKGALPRSCVVAPLFGITLFAFDLQKQFVMKNGLPKIFQ